MNRKVEIDGEEYDLDKVIHHIYHLKQKRNVKAREEGLTLEVRNIDKKIQRLQEALEIFGRVDIQDTKIAEVDTLRECVKDYKKSRLLEILEEKNAEGGLDADN